MINKQLVVLQKARYRFSVQPWYSDFQGRFSYIYFGKNCLWNLNQILYRDLYARQFSLSSFFASIHLLLAFIQSHINVCLLFSEYFKNILMLITTQARSFLFWGKSLCIGAWPNFNLKCNYLLVNGCSVYTKWISDQTFSFSLVESRSLPDLW